MQWITFSAVDYIFCGQLQREFDLKVYVFEVFLGQIILCAYFSVWYTFLDEQVPRLTHQRHIRAFW